MPLRYIGVLTRDTAGTASNPPGGKIEPNAACGKGCYLWHLAQKPAYRTNSTERAQSGPPVPFERACITANLAAMTNDPNSREQDIADHQEIQQSIRRLNRIMAWFRQNTILTMILLAAALAVLLEPALLR